MTAQRPAMALDRLPPGGVGRIREVGHAHARELLEEGLHPGADVRVRSASPLGGPLIVEVGRAIVAISRSVARTVVVESPPADGPRP